MKDTVYVFAVDGKEYRFNPDTTARTEREVRQATGMSVSKAMRTMRDDFGLDLLAVVAYAAELQAGRTPNFEAMLDDFSSRSEFTIPTPETEEVDPEM